MTRPRVTVHADDLGACPAVNDRIFRCHREGMLDSASLMVNMPGAEDALSRLQDHPALQVSLHLNLLEGRPLSSPREVPLLVNKAGLFHPGVLKTSMQAANPFRFAAYTQQVLAEFTAQAITFRRHLGGKSIDSHLHIHLLPWLFPIVREVARKYEFDTIRAPRRFFFCTEKNNGPSLVYTAKAVILGLLSNWQSGRVSRRTDYLITGVPQLSEIGKILGMLPARSTVELLFHPGGDAQHAHQLSEVPARLRNVHFLPARRFESELLCSSELEHLLSTYKPQDQLRRDSSST